MALNPLEGLMSSTADHQLVSSSMMDPGSPQPHVACSLRSPHRHRKPRKWVQSVCGSVSSSISGCGSVVQSRTLKNQHPPKNAARERGRVRNLRQAFHSLQAALPSVPPDTKLSKLDVLVLATDYIAYLTETLDQEGVLAEHTLASRPGGYLHPVKKWPMRSLLYCGGMGDLVPGVPADKMPLPGRDGTHQPTPTVDGNKE